MKETTEFRELLQEEHERIRTEYESKLRELEADRQEAEEGRAQVGRYKAGESSGSTCQSFVCSLR